MNRFRQILCKWIDSDGEFKACALHPIHMDIDAHSVYMNFGEVNGACFTIAVFWSEIPETSFDFFDMEY